MLRLLRKRLFGIKALQRVHVERCSKKVFWIDCFRWPEGPAETIQHAHRKRKAVKSSEGNCFQMLLGGNS